MSTRPKATSLESFFERWRALPPLLRAAAAAATVADQRQLAIRMAGRAANLRAEGLERRADVVMNGAEAASLTADLFAILAYEADLEATEAGIDDMAAGERGGE